MQLSPVSVSARTPELITALVALWERCVRATHTFLSPNEIKAIKSYVPQALQTVAHLVVAYDAAGKPLGFLGVQDARIEMLFLEPTARGHGLGRSLVQYARAHYAVTAVTVNEQNPQALGFYQHLGFVVVKRTELDEQAQPYPLLYLHCPPNH